MDLHSYSLPFDAPPPMVIAKPAARRDDPVTSHQAAEAAREFAGRNHRAIDMTGVRAGRLTAVQCVGRDEQNYLLWRCVCDCGRECVARGKDIRSGNTQSCGCLASEVRAKQGKLNKRHGRTYSPEWHSWQSMLARCNNPAHKSWQEYGGRGVRVCERWLRFENFAADMGDRPAGTTLDRISVNGDYEPNNCRWAPHVVQQRNRRKHHLLTAFGETKCLSAWIEDPRCAAKEDAVRWRLKRGWSVVDAITRPARRRLGLAEPSGRTVASDTGRAEREWRAVGAE